MIRYRLAGFLGALVAGTGCVDINGGAVELRWEIRKMDGAKISCDETRVTDVQLCATPYPPAADGPPAVCASWPCSDEKGTTAFDIPPRRYSLAIAPVCSDGTPPSASVPEPIVRDISNGNVAELNTLLIVKIGDSFICPTL